MEKFKSTGFVLFGYGIGLGVSLIGTRLFENKYKRFYKLTNYNSLLYNWIPITGGMYGYYYSLSK